MSVTRKSLATAVLSLALGASLATAGSAAAADVAQADRPKAPAAQQQPAPAGAKRAGRDATAPSKAKTQAASPRGERRARTIYYNGVTYFHSCTNWQRENNMFVYTCWWWRTLSSAPAGAHLIGFQSQTEWTYVKYYLGADGRTRVWYSGKITR